MSWSPNIPNIGHFTFEIDSDQIPNCHNKLSLLDKDILVLCLMLVEEIVHHQNTKPREAILEELTFSKDARYLQHVEDCLLIRKDFLLPY